MNRIPTFMVFLLLTAAVPAAAEYQAGLDAYTSGKYRKAMKEWREVVDEPPNEDTRPYYSESLYAIAMLYWQGQGVRQSHEKAVQWLNRAAARNHAGAQAKLGYLYTEGVGVPQDYGKAFTWYTQAARQGDVDGQYNLGIFYYYGWGTDQDRTMAAQYLAAASAQGDPAAEEALLRVLAEINPPTGEERPPGPVGHAGAPDSGELLQPEDWIRAQNPDHYTIQVIALSSLQRLQALVAEFSEHAPFAMYTVQRSSRPLYVLLQGDYADVDAARRARDYFPKQIQTTDKLWIRQFGMVQEQLEANP